ncbi:hypothetical protein BJ742DRAFT_249441 [Cladochytrium replicatum]|nr:hypothetical protein BJ742DRAFT_249441 [Cladochytrium replicatum]
MIPKFIDYGCYGCSYFATPQQEFNAQPTNAFHGQMMSEQSSNMMHTNDDQKSTHNTYSTFPAHTPEGPSPPFSPCNTTHETSMELENTPQMMTNERASVFFLNREFYRAQTVVNYTFVTPQNLIDTHVANEEDLVKKMNQMALGNSEGWSNNGAVASVS